MCREGEGRKIIVRHHGMGNHVEESILPVCQLLSLLAILINLMVMAESTMARVGSVCVCVLYPTKHIHRYVVHMSMDIACPADHSSLITHTHTAIDTLISWSNKFIQSTCNTLVTHHSQTSSIREYKSKTAWLEEFLDTRVTHTHTHTRPHSTDIHSKEAHTHARLLALIASGWVCVRHAL